MATALPKDFKDFLKLLKENNVEYLVVGGYAVGFFGYPRATNDLDVWVAIDPENAKKIKKVLRDFGFAGKEITEDLFLRENNVIRMGNPPIRIEILTTASGVDFKSCYQRRITETIDDVQIDFIGLKDLKTNKQASGRHKDLDDLENLP